MSKTSVRIQQLLNEGAGRAGCLLIRFPVADCVEIQKWVEENIAPENIITPERETHVTVLYGVKDTIPPSEIEAFCAQLPFVVLKLKSIGLFNQDLQDVLKIEVESPQLIEINRRLREYLGEHNIEPSKFAYNPHVTLAYVKKGSCDQFKGNDRFNGYVYLLKDAVYSEPNSVIKHEFKLSN